MVNGEKNRGGEKQGGFYKKNYFWKIQSML